MEGEFDTTILIVVHMTQFGSTENYLQLNSFMLSVGSFIISIPGSKIAAG